MTFLRRFRQSALAQMGHFRPLGGALSLHHKAERPGTRVPQLWPQTAPSSLNVNTLIKMLHLLQVSSKEEIKELLLSAF